MSSDNACGIARLGVAEYLRTHRKELDEKSKKNDKITERQGERMISGKQVLCGDHGSPVSLLRKKSRSLSILFRKTEERASILDGSLLARAVSGALCSQVFILFCMKSVILLPG